LNDAIAIGKRVVVQFGKSKLYTAVVAAITRACARKVRSQVHHRYTGRCNPLLPNGSLQFWQWLAEYYMCNEGEVMNAALPSALKLASETKVMLNRDFEYDKTQLNDKEYLITEALDIQPELTISDIVKLLGPKNGDAYPEARCSRKNIVTISEEVSERYKPRKRTYITLNPRLS
jgi:primosomal protein N' (replication factor Y)